MEQKNLDKKRNPAISLVKVVAMLLIINSHSDNFFPERISFLATGGALGNELFFLVGGYLYSMKRSIVQTTYRRFIRLYIPTYLMTIILYVLKIISIGDLLSPKEIVYRFIWPTSFWFVSSIFVNGLLFHLLYKINFFSTYKKIVLFTIIFSIINLLIYVLFIPDKETWIVEDYKFFGGMFYYKCIYSFAVFSIGYLLRVLETEGKLNINKKVLFGGALVSFVAFYILKLFFDRGIIPMKFQLLSQPITVICVIFIMLWLLKSSLIYNWLNSSNRLSNYINKLGEITLEAFLVQFEIITAINKLKIIFPLNYIINVFAIIIAAFLFHYINNIVCTFLIRKIENSSD